MSKCTNCFSLGNPVVVELTQIDKSIFSKIHKIIKVASEKN